PALFVEEQSVIQITAGILLIVAVFQLSDGFQVVGLSALRGLEDVRLPTGIALFAYWMVGLPVGYVLGIYWEFGAQGVWMGLLAGLSTAALLLTLRFYSRTTALMQSQQ
ncbi:MAG: MATE family efflux transporter, partial [Bacteroidetes bacterium SW_11_45_7]